MSHGPAPPAPQRPPAVPRAHRAHPPAALRTARAELAAALVHELLDAPPPMPGKLRERVSTVHGKLQRLVEVLRQAEAGRPPARG